jgi:hypothetical protein
MRIGNLPISGMAEAKNARVIHQRMSEHQKQSKFLKTLLAYDDSEEHRRLQSRIEGAEKDERCIGCACRLVGLVTLLSVAGLGYSAVLLPEFFSNSRNFLVQFFCALGLGSILCLFAFVGLWCWYRAIVHKLHDECRRLISSLMRSRFGTTSQQANFSVTPRLVALKAEPMPEGIVSLHKAS